MATLARLTVLTAILIISLSHCSFKQDTTNSGVSRSNNSTIPKEKVAQNDVTNTGKPKLRSSVRRKIYRSNCLQYKDPQEATAGSNSILSRHLNRRSPCARANFKSDRRFKQRNRRIAVVSTEPNYTPTQENRSTVNTENERTKDSISLHLHELQQLGNANNTSANDVISTDYSDESNFSRLQVDVHYGGPEKKFVIRNEKEVSNLQTNTKSTTSKRSLKEQKAKAGTTHEQRASLINAHNKILSTLEYPAANIVFTVYNAQLEKVAYKWANQCDSTAEFPLLDFDLHFNEGELGRNSGADESFSWDAMLATWMSGKADFDVINSRCSVDSRHCNDYIRLIRAETNYIGCSVAFCQDYVENHEHRKNVYNYACYYTPSGNTVPAGILRMQIRPYKRGTPATECPPTHTYVWGNFCRSDPPCRDVKECVYPRDINTCLCESSFYDSGQKSIVLRWTLLDFAVILVTVAYSSINACS